MPAKSLSVLWWVTGVAGDTLLLCYAHSGLPRASRNYTSSCIWGPNPKKGPCPMGREKRFPSCSGTEQTLPAAHSSHQPSACLPLILLLRLPKKELDLPLTAWPNFPGKQS